MQVKAYHGSNVPIKKFDREFSAQGVFWFSEDKDSILNGKSGAVSNNYLIEVTLTVNKTAGWEEYDKLMLKQIEDDGYDSIHLDDDWIVFDSKNIRIDNVIKIKKEESMKSQARLLLESINESNAKAGFDLTSIPADKWKQMLKQFGMPEDAEVENYDGSPIGFKWQGDDIVVLTGNNPITGEYGQTRMKREPEVGFASHIGIEGDADKVKGIFDFIKKNADYIKGYNKTEREFI